MAKDNTAAVAEPELDQDLLERAALHMYSELARGRMRNFSPTHIAEQAYVEAKAFAVESACVRSGKQIVDKQKQEEPLFVVVHIWDMSKGEKGELQRDKDGNIVTEVQPVDRRAFAPNLPDGHPINQRWYPNAIKTGRLCDASGKLLTANN